MLEDIIAVERELTRVREEIERLEGRMRYLGHRVAFSTAAITLQEKPRTQPLLPPESFSTGRVASEATRALVSFGQGLWARVIWAGVWAGVWAPLAVLAWAVRQWIRRLRARRRAGLHREASASGTGPAPNG